MTETRGFVKKAATNAPVMFYHHLLTGETTTYGMKQEAQPARNWKNF